MEEFMFLGLRMTEGISERQFERNFGCRIEDIYGSVLAKYKDDGFTGTHRRVLALYQERESM